MKTKQAYTFELENGISICKEQIEVIVSIKPILKQLNGISIRQFKRIENKIKKAMPDTYRIYYHEKYPWYELGIGKYINNVYESLLKIHCGYTCDTTYFDYDKIVNYVGNNYYFGTDSNYSDVNQTLEKFEKQLENIDSDYEAYQKIHEMVEKWNVSYLPIRITG